MSLWTASTTTALLAMSVIAGAETPEAQLMVPIRHFSDSFNKGDMKAAAATLSSSGVTIIDEISPHIWEGPNAFDTYLKAFAAFDQAEGITDEAYKPGKPIRVEVNGIDGYVVLPVVYTFKKKGAPMQEAAHMVYVLRKGTAAG